MLISKLLMQDLNLPEELASSIQQHFRLDWGCAHSRSAWAEIPQHRRLKKNTLVVVTIRHLTLQIFRLPQIGKACEASDADVFGCGSSDMREILLPCNIISGSTATPLWTSSCLCPHRITSVVQYLPVESSVALRFHCTVNISSFNCALLPQML